MKLQKGLRRGISTVADIKSRSIVDPVTHCWQWQGGMGKGKAVILIQ